jgi:hypothetical protein
MTNDIECAELAVVLVIRPTISTEPDTNIVPSDQVYRLGAVFVQPGHQKIDVGLQNRLLLSHCLIRERIREQLPQFRVLLAAGRDDVWVTRIITESLRRIFSILGSANFVAVDVLPSLRVRESQLVRRNTDDGAVLQVQMMNCEWVVPNVGMIQEPYYTSSCSPWPGIRP